ncbi:MAG: hypothetical protein RQ847_06235 [Wenzhouxiangellaceae bacterium]|nr:hypothetical protein [Wenzhouxiangellaceae bacterium]
MQQTRIQQPGSEHLVVRPHYHNPAALHAVVPPSPGRLRAAVVLIYAGLMLTLAATLVY